MEQFTWPWQYNFPPFFTLQPNLATREKQIEAWSSLVLQYCQHFKRFDLDVVEAQHSDLFQNDKINHNLEWLDKQKSRCRIFWRSPADWGKLIYDWIVSTGQLQSVCTLYELAHGEDTVNEAFHGISEEVLTESLKTLEDTGKAEIIRSDSSVGGYVYALRPTPEMWTKNLLKRTQVLYLMDTSTVVLHLELKPGSVVVEAGCGSGSLSHVMLRTIAPHGKLFTFDVNAERVDSVRRDFAKNGFEAMTVVEQRDVCSDGFGVTEVADALFLDLPRPWEVIRRVKTVFKPNRVCRFGSFSPCIEQVQKTCEALRKERFVEIDVLECVVRYYRVSSITMQTPRVLTTSSRPIEPARKRFRAESHKAQDDKPGDGTARNLTVVQQQNPNPSSFLTFTPEPPEQPSHTGYLTFATVLPRRQTTVAEDHSSDIVAVTPLFNRETSNTS
ncbi:unnamed protein product [Soboliphyme baturini]|uniref:Vacuolar protein-sorting-associated protein 25 n=1 Tax=Soboliphyme baturini TaxID=241478 RepID=A0A183IPC9_9BILA|nr:unnamed protein product [Soboliphyme baturini]